MYEFSNSCNCRIEMPLSFLWMPTVFRYTRACPPRRPTMVTYVHQFDGVRPSSVVRFVNVSMLDRLRVLLHRVTVRHARLAESTSSTTSLYIRTCELARFTSASDDLFCAMRAWHPEGGGCQDVSIHVPYT